MNKLIPFNKPSLVGKELEYIHEAVSSGKISGEGMFTALCHKYFENRYAFPKVLLTTSCTDALEMAAILLEIKEGDEVIIPSFTFVSTANAFALRGAKIVFADSQNDHPNIDLMNVESLITERTKVLVLVHYAGVSVDIKEAKRITEKYGLFLVEDAAQAIDSYYIDEFNNRVALGSIGHLAAFSFHETKNIVCGEGGMLVINDKRFIERAEVIREKGTNRSAFFRGEINKYGWVDIGSSFLPSDILAAFLYAQLENIDLIQTRRLTIYNKYYNGLMGCSPTNLFELPKIPAYATNNAHMFYLVCKDFQTRSNLIAYLKEKGVMAVFHYLSLHDSEFYQDKHDGRILVNSDRFSDCLLRLPIYYNLSDDSVDQIISSVNSFASLNAI